MAEEKIVSSIETSGEFSEKVMREIGSLRDELAAIRQLLERGHSLSNAIEEYRYLPPNLENPIRWGFIGVWGKGSSCTYSIITMKQDDYFNKPHSSDEVVAGFASAFANPNTIKVCKCIFRNKEHSREEIKQKCKLTDEELYRFDI